MMDSCYKKWADLEKENGVQLYRWESTVADTDEMAICKWKINQRKISKMKHNWTKYRVAIEQNKGSEAYFIRYNYENNDNKV